MCIRDRWWGTWNSRDIFFVLVLLSFFFCSAQNLAGFVLLLVTRLYFLDTFFFFLTFFLYCKVMPKQECFPACRRCIYAHVFFGRSASVRRQVGVLWVWSGKGSKAWIGGHSLPCFFSLMTKKGPFLLRAVRQPGATVELLTPKYASVEKHRNIKEQRV